MLEDYRHAAVGIEGLVIKDRDAAYEPGRRGWLKYRIRDTHEVVVGAVTGSLEDPQELILGYFDAEGELVIAGSTTRLGPSQRTEVARYLHAPANGHPWPTEIGSGRLGHWSGQPRAVTLVQPSLVVEISADSSVQSGAWRHVTRFVRSRPDLSAGEIDPALG
jgi:ATP-dependent DNA ligase